MSAYYNEIDPFAAQWLRNLAAAGHIAPGDVDERSIVDVQPEDVRGYRQAHFFAGIGIWSLALRNAGWPDDRPVWSGSCPCQPFSIAGKQRGSDDERHLWPAFFRLIRECRPPVVVGEQVAGAAGLAWIDHVCADLEDAGYAATAADLCAAGVGAPHIRQRLYWVADAHDAGSQGRGRAERRQFDADGQTDSRGSAIDSMVYTYGSGRGQDDWVPSECPAEDRRREAGRGGGRSDAGYWSDAEWIWCRDGKYRPAKPGIFPLVDGYPGPRVGILRAAGNALVAPLATEFIAAVMECLP